MNYKFLIAIMLLVALSAQAAAAESLQGATYTITPAGDTNEYRISISVSNITAGGLSIEFPGTFEIVDTDIPADHYGSDGETFIATLTGETEIYIDVVCPDLATGEILSTWDDITTGTHGGEELSVKESEKEQSPVATSAKETPFGYSGIFALLSAGIAGFLVKSSGRNTSKGEE